MSTLIEKLPQGKRKESSSKKLFNIHIITSLCVFLVDDDRLAALCFEYGYVYSLHFAHPSVRSSRRPTTCIHPCIHPSILSLFVLLLPTPSMHHHAAATSHQPMKNSKA